MFRCPVYIPMIPQAHVVVQGGAPQTGHASASSAPGNEAGQSATLDGQANSNQQHHQSHAAAATQKLNTSVQYCQMYMQGYVPVAALAPKQQVPPANADSEPQTGPSTRTSTPPSLLQMQLSQLEQYIEVLLSTQDMVKSQGCEGSSVPFVALSIEIVAIFSQLPENFSINSCRLCKSSCKRLCYCNVN